MYVYGIYYRPCSVLNSEYKMLFYRGGYLLLIILIFYRITVIKAIIQDSLTVISGDDAVLICQLSKTTETLTRIAWQRRTKEKPTNTEFFAVTKDGEEIRKNGLEDRVKFTGDISRFIGSICIDKVTPSDDGNYTCTISIFPSGPIYTEIHLRVQVPPSVSVSTDGPPVAGDTEQILATCTAARANPAAEVTWNLGSLKDSVIVKTNIAVDSEGRFTVNSSLIGLASKDLNQRTVQCLVKHPALKENLTLDYTLNIHYPPQYAEVYRTLEVDQEEACEFQCEADANPKPTHFNWSRRSLVKELISSGDDSRLVVQLNTESKDVYVCVASNQYGSAVGSLYVHVIPRITPTDCSISLAFFIITLLALVGVILTWKFNLDQKVIQILPSSRGDPVPTD